MITGGMSSWVIAKPLVDEAIGQDLPPRGFNAFYPAALSLSSRTLTPAARIKRCHRKQTGSPWRKLSPGRQALLMLVYLLK